MVTRSILIIAFLVIQVFPPSAAAESRFTLGLQGSGGVLLTRAAGLSLQPQADGLLELQAAWRFPLRGRVFEEPRSALSVGAGLGWHYAFPSAFFDHGFQYRGSTGPDLHLFLGWDTDLRLLALGLPVRGGVQAGGFARLDRYAWTGLSFFYPGLALEPFVELGPRASTSRFTYRVLLPLQLHFRRDLESSTTLGLGFALLYRPGGRSSAP